MDQLLQDIRFAVRMFLRSPGFTAVAVLTLALGIGANTAIFSIVNGVLLRPLGYPQPERLMYLTTQFPSLRFAQFWVAPPEYMEFRELNRSFAAVGAYTTGEANLTAVDRPRRVRVAAVDDHLLKALAVQPAHGRLFASGETEITGTPAPPPAPPLLTRPVAIMSHELWQSAFGGRPLVGQMVDVDGRRREIIGIMPPGFDLMDNRTELWLPLGLNPGNRQNRGNHYLYLVGRLKNGVTAQAAQTELDALIANWRDRIGLKPGPGAASHVFAPLTKEGGHILQMTPLQQQMLAGAGRSIWVLQAAVGLVLLIACANLANLLLARAETRQREFAVRTAVGASRVQLLRQLMTEGVVLSAAGGALGVVLARAGVKALVTNYPASLPRTSEVNVDPTVLLFTFVVAAASGIVFGLAPFVHAKVEGLVVSLKEGAKGSIGGTRHHVRRALVATEVALAVMVVIGAALLVRTVANLTSIDAGFNRSRLVTFSITLPRATYPQPSSRERMFQTVLAKLRGVAGVQGASAMTGLPPNRPLNANDTDIENYTAPPGGPYENVDYYQTVTADYFETMGIPIVEGRGFERADAASPGLVAIVNETMADTFWKGRSPIGQRVRPCCGDAIPWRTIVGVTKDVKQGGVAEKTGTELYAFLEQAVGTSPPRGNVPETLNVVLRTTLAPAALAQTVERAVREADRSVPVVRLREMDDVFAESISRPRLLAQLTGGFAGLALLLAAIGTYGVLAFMVVERRREIGIRLALGQDRLSILGHVMRQGLIMTGVGVVIGLAGAFGANRLLESLLFGVRPTDPATMAAVVAAIALVAAVACGLPA